jgi:hypothetical protein
LTNGSGGGFVTALAVDGMGNLYACGVFTTAGGASANNIAKWNGTGWSALGSGVGGSSSYPSELALDGAGNLYAGGNFTTAGGVPANYVAKWDGTTWSALDSGITAFFANGPVRALGVDGAGNLYAGGDFISAGGVAANQIAKWDGVAWSVPGGAPAVVATNGTVSAVAFDGSGNLYAGGSFATAGGVTVNCVAKWDGSAWSALGTGMIPSNLDSLVVRDLAVDSAGNLYASGEFTMAGGVPGTSLIAKWDGSAWSALGSGPPFQVTALAVFGTDLYVGGGVSNGNIAKWNGSVWSALGTGLTNGSGGGFVTALAVDGMGNLYACGVFTTAGGAPANNIAKWNGTAWSALGSGVSPGSTVSSMALAVSGTDLYVGGKITTAGGVPVNYVAKWNGTAWSALGSGINGRVEALGVSGTNLYAGGDFTTAGGVPANNIAVWNGSIWSPLGSGIGGGSVDALAVDGLGNLYAGGHFVTAGGKVSAHLAKAVTVSVKINTVSRTGGAGPVTVTIDSYTGHSYQLQRSLTLNPASFTNVGAVQNGVNGNVLTLTDSTPPATQAFYRIAVGP